MTGLRPDSFSSRVTSISGFNKMMIEKILKGIAVGFALLMVTILVLYLNRSDPFGTIPGKRLRDMEK